MRPFQILFLSIMFLASLFCDAGYAAEREKTLSIPRMTCALCPVTIESALRKRDGILQVIILLAEKRAIVTFEDSKINELQLIQTIAEAGYEAKIVP